ncbi:hypothetical protein JW906_02940 [bacterium]|nr:hypothetical protein [bacterium]
MRMSRHLIVRSAILILIVTVPALPREGLSVVSLVEALKANPNDAESWRELGIILFENDMTDRAGTCLVRAYKLNPEDGQTLFYLGLFLEDKQKFTLALRLYSRYTKIPEASPYREAMEGRYRILTRRRIREDIRAMIQGEKALDMRPPTPGTVAVMPLAYKGADAQVAVLGKGIAEMIMTDLSQIKSLQIVERLRVQALMDEIALGQTGLIADDQTAGYGRMVGAGKVVFGDFTTGGKNRMQLDVVCGDVINKKYSDPIILRDAVQNVFLLEKELVFKVIGEMGISVSPSEREQIQSFPTQNLQAFMAYCKGLEMEDQGRFAEAVEYYNQAAGLDPDFQKAVEKSAVNQTLSRSQDRRALRFGNVMTARERQDFRERPPDISRQMLEARRMQTVHQDLGSMIRTGVDSRKSPEESAIAETGGASIEDALSLPDMDRIDWGTAFEDLDEPPDPPSLPSVP